ncbi:MAG: hypothetical protein EZS28_023866, partial [Streblomastix strix]
MYVSSRKCGGFDTEECGDAYSTCNSFEHAVLKQTTPDRTPTNLQCGFQIANTFISVCEMHMNQPYRTEADIFMLGGGTTDEISAATKGGSIFFDENGEMEFSDQDYWKIEKLGRVDYSSINGVNLKVLFHLYNIVVPTMKQVKYILNPTGGIQRKMRMGQIPRKNLYVNIGVASRQGNQSGGYEQQLNERGCWRQPISNGGDATQRRFVQIVVQQRVRMVTRLPREWYGTRATGQGQESEGAVK